MVPRRLSFLLLIPAFVVSISCNQETIGPPPLGEAYAGPATLPLRQDISPRSPVSGLAKHGDRLDVLETRRRFVKVRTPQGQTGWVDVRLLMSPEQMKDLRSLGAQASKMPSEGSAVVLEAVNIHTEPNRLAPSFAQLPEKAQVEVVARQVTLRSQHPPPSMSFHRHPLRRREPKKKRGAVDITPPAPPGVPSDWIGLSKDPKMAPVDDQPKPEDERDRFRRRKKAGPAVDDWSLVRTGNGSAGWVLSRMLNMAIPDEVAQYAEGHRITSYFSLGKVQDEEDGVKSHWLWTTMAGVRSDCDFDGFRVFIWNRRRHRYETAYMEKRLIGRYPVEANIDGRTGTFAVITQDQDTGRWLRRTFILDGYQVHKLGEEPYIPGQTPAAGQGGAQANPSKAKSAGWSFAAIQQKLHNLFAK